MSSRQRQLKLFLIVFIPLWLLLTVAGAMAVGLMLREQERQLTKSLARQANQLVRNAEIQIKSLVSDVNLLAISPELNRCLANHGIQDLEMLGRGYLAFCRSKPGFLGIVLLDASGRPLLMVHGRQERITPRPDGHYLSPPPRTPCSPQWDNWPPREMVLTARPPRAAEREWHLELMLPLTDDQGNRSGCLWIDYSGAEFIQGLGRELKLPGRIMILDTKGRLLYCQNNVDSPKGEPPCPSARGSVEFPQPGMVSQSHTLYPMNLALKVSSGAGEATLTSATGRPLGPGAALDPDRAAPAAPMESIPGGQRLSPGSLLSGRLSGPGHCQLVGRRPYAATSGSPT